MTKEDFIKLLRNLNISIAEGIQKDTDTNIYPRVVFWEYVWEPFLASGEKYNTKVTSQVSFFSLIPRDPKLLELINDLKFNKINPIIYHEYIQKEKYFHSYFSIDWLENV